MVFPKIHVNYNANSFFSQLFRGLKFCEYIKSAKFVENKYLEKTNYKVTMYRSKGLKIPPR